MVEDIVKTKTLLRTTFLPTELTSKGKTLERPFIYSSFQQLVEKGPPSSKRVLVIGSGERTGFWKSRGAETLDIDERFRPDFVADANNLVEATGEDTFDIILAEAVTVDPEGKRGVNFERMVHQASKALRPNGELFIQTASIGSLPEEEWPIPNPKTAMQIMVDAGFRSVAVYRGELITTSQDYTDYRDKILVRDLYHDAQAIYYGRKPKEASLSKTNTSKV